MSGLYFLPQINELKECISLDELKKLFLYGIYKNKNAVTPDDVDDELLSHLSTLPSSQLHEAVQFAAEGKRLYGHKILPLHLLLHLSTLKNKEMFYKAFETLIDTPDDIQTFLGYMDEGKLKRGMGRSVKTAINTFFSNKMDARMISLYRKRIQDIMKRSHYKEQLQEENHLVKYLEGESIDDERVKVLEYLRDSIGNKNHLTYGMLDLITEKRIEFSEIRNHIINLNPLSQRLVHMHAIYRKEGIEMLEEYLYFEKKWNRCGTGDMPFNVTYEALRTKRELGLAPFFFYQSIMDGEVKKRMERFVPDLGDAGIYPGGVPSEEHWVIPEERWGEYQSYHLPSSGKIYWGQEREALPEGMIQITGKTLRNALLINDIVVEGGNLK